MEEESELIEICSGDDDYVPYEMLKWSGLHEKWDNLMLDSHFNFFMDVVQSCDHAFIEDEEWDANFPGHSGTSYVVYTDDEKEFKRELKEALDELIKKSRKLIGKTIVEEWKRCKEAEWAKRTRKPRNKRFLFTLDILDDIAPTKYHYYMEYLKGTPTRYRLWEKSDFWYPMDCYVTAQEDFKKTAKDLVRFCFARWPGNVVGYEGGKLLANSDIETIERQML